MVILIIWVLVVQAKAYMRYFSVLKLKDLYYIAPGAVLSLAVFIYKWKFGSQDSQLPKLKKY